MVHHPALNSIFIRGAGWDTEGMRPFVHPSRLILLYDEHCRLCLRSVAFLKNRKGSEVLQPMPLQTPGILDHFGIREEDALKELHAVDKAGRIYVGAEGVLRSLAILPRWRWVGALLKVPGVLPATRPVYRFIASRRARKVCENGSCHL